MLVQVYAYPVITALAASGLHLFCQWSTGVRVIVWVLSP